MKKIIHCHRPLVNTSGTGEDIVLPKGVCYSKIPHARRQFNRVELVVTLTDKHNMRTTISLLSKTFINTLCLLASSLAFDFQQCWFINLDVCLSDLKTNVSLIQILLNYQRGYIINPQSSIMAPKCQPSWSGRNPKPLSFT